MKIALSGPTYKSYKDATGFDDCEKYLDAFNLKLNQGKNVPVWIVYYFYYKWTKESTVRPEPYSIFVRTWGKHTRSMPWSCMTTHQHFRAYKILGFPPYTAQDELQARKLIREQKERIRNKKRKKQVKGDKQGRNKEVL